MTEIVSIIADIAAIAGTIGVISAIIALLMTQKQMSTAARTLGLDLVANTLHGFSANERLQKLYYEHFEYSGSQPDLPTHEIFGMPIERDLDSLLILFSVPALAWEKGQLKLEDMQPLKYYICKIAKNKGMQKYLEWLEEWLPSQNISQHPYLSFRNLAGQLMEQEPNLLKADNYKYRLKEIW
jgi:hypothetical protein